MPARVSLYISGRWKPYFSSSSLWLGRVDRLSEAMVKARARVKCRERERGKVEETAG